MNIKDRIKKEIKIQKEIEGENCQDEIFLKFLEAAKTSMQWQTWVDIKYYGYGKLSYQRHRFYYPKQELLDFIKLIKELVLS